MLERASVRIAPERAGTRRTNKKREVYSLKMRLHKLVLGILLLTVSAFAADIDGKWTGTIATPNGDVPQTFTFKATGTTLTGSLLIMEGMEVPIADGKIDGNNISFSITLDFGMPFKITYTAVVSGNDLSVKADAAGMPFEFALKKAS